MKEVRQDIRLAPYYNVSNQAYEYTLMSQLRNEFVPKLKRRFPSHHLCGWRHDYVVSFVSKQKQTYPYFLRTDISRFYPNVRHRDVLLFSQLAYRDLLGMSYVPKKFKTVYLKKIKTWLEQLPLHERGIPLGSPVSAVLAPLLLLPLWFKLRRLFDVKMLVYADDLLLFCKSQEVCGRVFTCLYNRLLEDYDLQLQAEKTYSGRFSENEVNYCGWNFKGGYSRISAEKIERFKERLSSEIERCRSEDIRVFIKRLNRKIDGFGHYYKYGNVCKQFVALDVYIRTLVRKGIYCRYNKSRFDNEALQRLGLRSLEEIHQGGKKVSPVSNIAHYRVPQTVQESEVSADRYILLQRQVSETSLIRSQLQQIIRLQRENIRLFEQLIKN